MQRKDVRLHPHTRSRVIDRFCTGHLRAKPCMTTTCMCLPGWWTCPRSGSLVLRRHSRRLLPRHRGTVEAPSGSARIDRERTVFGALKWLLCVRKLRGHWILSQEATDTTGGASICRREGHWVPPALDNRVIAARSRMS